VLQLSKDNRESKVKSCLFSVPSSMKHEEIALKSQNDTCRDLLYPKWQLGEESLN